TVVTGDLQRVRMPATRLPITEAIPRLLQPPDHRSATFWAAATRLALKLVAAGRLLPGLTTAGYDAWQVGPLTSADVDLIRRLAAAMPPEARAIPISGMMLPSAETLLRAYVDAVADTMPRSPAAPLIGGRAYAAAE